MSDEIETEVVTVDPRTLKGLERNARYMKAHQFRQLVENIKRDGRLTQLPLVYLDGTILSGNHRVRASIEAGLETIEIQRVVTELSEARQLALQLSHTAISGEDDPSLLQELYEELPYDEKLYSGITDDMFEVEKIDLASLSAGSTEYQELTMTFLPADAEIFTEYIQKIENDARRLHLVADLRDFNDLFDSIIAVKQKKNVFNTALAIKAMMELALDRLLQLEQETEDADAQADAASSD